MTELLKFFYYVIIYVFTFIIVVDCKSVLANLFFSYFPFNIFLGENFFLILYTLFNSTLLTFIFLLILHHRGCYLQFTKGLS